MRGIKFWQSRGPSSGVAGGLAVLLAGVVLSAGAALGRTSAAVVVHSASVSGPSSTATMSRSSSPQGDARSMS